MWGRFLQWLINLHVSNPKPEVRGITGPHSGLFLYGKSEFGLVGDPYQLVYEGVWSTGRVETKLAGAQPQLPGFPFRFLA